MRYIISFILKHYFVFLFLLLEGLSVFFISKVSFFQSAIINSYAYSIVAKVSGQANNLKMFFNLKNENLKLVNENSRLMNIITKNQLLTDTTSIYKNDTVNNKQYKYFPAQVINNSTNLTHNYLLLNKGLKDGIKRDMAVISPTGIAGTVINVSENFCLVMSLLNIKSRVSAKIKRTEQIGTVVWEGESPLYCNLIDIPAHIKVNKNDTILTSGFSNVFPKDFMIGTVIDTEPDESNHFYKVKFKLSTDFNTLHNVYIVKNLFQSEQEKLANDYKL